MGDERVFLDCCACEHLGVTSNLLRFHSPNSLSFESLKSKLCLGISQESLEGQMKKGLFLILLMFSQNSFSVSNGFLVGNGGGLAEMQALHLDSSLKQQLKSLGGFEEFVEKLNGAEKLLSFNPSCTAGGYAVFGDKISIDSCRLYSDVRSPLGERPLSLEEIGSWIFAVRWVSVYPSDSFEEALLKGRKLHLSLNHSFLEHPFVQTGKHVGSFIVQKSAGNYLFALEFLKGSVDLRESLIREAGCLSLTGVSFKNTETLNFGSKMFFGSMSAEWSCNGKIFEGDVLININFNGEGVAVKEKSTVLLRAVKVIGNSCKASLTPL